MKEAEFIAAAFFDFEIPKDKKYLTKYFYTDLQQTFLKYFMMCGSVRNFTDHTGHHCDRRLVKRMRANYRRLVALYESSKKALTEEGMYTVDLIESGKFPLTKLPKC